METQKITPDQLTTKARIKEMVGELNVEHSSLLKIKYDSDAKDSPFTITNLFSILPIIEYNQIIKSYVIVISNKSMGFTLKSNDALNLANDITKIARLNKYINLLLIAHKSIKH
jgi:hypothetical protein